MRVKKAIIPGNGSTSPTPVHISKPTPVEKMSIPSLVLRDATLEAISKIAQAKTLGGAISQIAAIAASPNASVAEISSIVKQDPLVAIRVVQLAGSAKYAGTNARIGSIKDAVRIIGVTELCSLVASMAVYDAFAVEKNQGVDLLRCWHHAIAVASMMDYLVPKSDATPPGFPYLVGLCHDLAEIRLRQCFPSEFAAILDFALQANVPPAALTQQVFGVPYSELVQTLFDRLQIPPYIAAPIKDFVSNNAALPDRHSSVLSRALCIANFLAHSAQCSLTSNAFVAPTLQSDYRTLLISSNPINLPELRSESLMTISMLAKLAGDQEAALMKPLLPKKDKSLWYFRHPHFSSLDPLEHALSNLCKVAVHPRLPQPAETTALDALIIVSPESIPITEILRIPSRIGKRIPILYLTPSNTADSSTLPADIAMECYPITLNRLAHFISP